MRSVGSVASTVRRHLLRAAAAVCTGVLLDLAFPPVNAWPAAAVGVAAMSLLMRGSSRRAAAGLGMLVGLGLWVPLLTFLRGYGLAAWLGLSVIESLWWLLLGLALRTTSRLRCWPLAAALLWVGQEWLRDRVPFDGFPWGRLAFGQADGPLVRLASLGGAPLVTFAVAATGALLAYAATTVSGPRLRLLAPTLALGAIAVIVVGPLAIRLPTAGTSAGGRPASAVVAAIQGDVPRLGLNDFAQRRVVTQNHMLATEALAARVAAGTAPKPDLAIWPENSSDVDPFADAQARAYIEAAVSSIDVPIVVGAVLNGPGPNQVRNTAIVWTPRFGPTQQYVKRHLVPFGEYLPFRREITSITSAFALIHKDFVPGHTPGVLKAGRVTLADVICFEVADDTVVRQAVAGGGRLLSVQTNNASYERAGDSGNGGETAQQLEMARLRAIEHGRAVVVAATSGVSAIISPSGSVLARTGVFTAASLDMRVPLRDPLTIADRVTEWPDRVLSLGGLLLLLLACRTRRRSQGEEDVEASTLEPVGASS
jgi:apolipoprotein N-acyltransferase